MELVVFLCDNHGVLWGATVPLAMSPNVPKVSIGDTGQSLGPLGPDREAIPKGAKAAYWEPL